MKGSPSSRPKTLHSGKKEFYVEGQKIMIDNDTREGLIGKYRLAGKIRLISASLLLFFLLLMKWIGGYAYLNIYFVSLIFVEAVLNQPYSFIIRRVNIHRFQYYQMAIDIISISWVLYYMGGIEAPVIGIAYYAVILWAGVTSSPGAVFFAVSSAALFLSSVVLLEYNGMLLPVPIYNQAMTDARLFSLLFGNIAFLFAFGYFSAHCSQIVKFLERKRRDESLRYAHKFLAIDHIITNTTHDISGSLANVKCCTEALLIKKGLSKDTREMLSMIDNEEAKAADLLFRLSRFSRKEKPELKHTDMNKVIEDAIKLTWPLVKYSRIVIEKDLDPMLPSIMANAEQIQEVLVALIFNSIDAVTVKGTLNIKTNYCKKKNVVEMILSDNGTGIKQEYLNRIYDPFFTTKEPKERFGIGLSVSKEIINRHHGNICAESIEGKGATFTIQVPVEQTA